MTDSPQASPFEYNLRMIAAFVCMKLRKGDGRIGIGLVERYRYLIDEALAEWGEDAEDEAYLAEVVVNAFRWEANATYGDPLPPGAELAAA